MSIVEITEPPGRGGSAPRASPRGRGVLGPRGRGHLRGRRDDDRGRRRGTSPSARGTCRTATRSATTAAGCCSSSPPAASRARSCDMSTPARERTLPPASEEPPDMGGLEDDDRLLRLRDGRGTMRDPHRDGLGNDPGGLWGERARDWAEVMEGWNGWGVPVYRHVLEHVAVGSGHHAPRRRLRRRALLPDRRRPRRRGRRHSTRRRPSSRSPVSASRTATSASARWRTSRGPDDSFDVVTGFNSFFIAADMVNALREARRVARPGASVAMTVFGRPERCQSTTVFSRCAGSRRRDRRTHRPRRTMARASTRRACWRRVATEAGLEPRQAGYLEFAEEYPDLETMLRGYLAAPPFVRAARTAGEEPVREALAEALRAAGDPDGPLPPRGRGPLPDRGCLASGRTRVRRGRGQGEGAGPISAAARRSR